MVTLSRKRGTRGSPTGDQPAPPSQPSASDRASRAPAGDTDDEVIAYWHVWRGPVARAVLPIIDDLRASEPTITSALVLAPSGISICHSGLDADGAKQLGELAASAYAHGLAATLPPAAVRQGAALDLMTMSAGDSHSILVTIPGLVVGVVLLCVVVVDTNVGLALVQARRTAEKIRLELATRETAD